MVEERLCAAGCGKRLNRTQRRCCSFKCAGAIKAARNRTLEFFYSRILCSIRTQCWLWQGDRSKKGYGSFSRDGKIVMAHHVSWELTYGEPPKGRWILHSCAGLYPAGDFTNRGCVNPAHLRLGTAKENAEDRTTDKRWWHTGHPGRTKRGRRLTRAEVTDIKTLIASGTITMAEIARRHEVDRAVIYRIRDAKTWTFDISGRTPWHKLTAEQRAEIAHRYQTQLTPQKELAREYGISQTHVSRIINGAIKDTAEY